MSRPKRSIIDDALAIRAKVRYEGQCWVWTGGLINGYGRVQFRGRLERAHRAAYLLSGRAIPDGAVLDHLCRNRACVNPSHLEPVSIGENARRGGNSLKARCPQGHPYEGANLRARQYADQFARVCRTCVRERAATRRVA